LVLQQTLDSARVTFANAQKITSDLDELTGDPEFRQNVREIVDGLSGLVSSTQQLEQQVQVAENLDPKPEEDLNMTANNNLPVSVMPNFDGAEFSLAQKTLKPILPVITEEGRREN